VSPCAAPFCIPQPLIFKCLFLAQKIRSYKAITCPHTEKRQIGTTMFTSEFYPHGEAKNPQKHKRHNPQKEPMLNSKNLAVLIPKHGHHQWILQLQNLPHRLQMISRLQPRCKTGIQKACPGSLMVGFRETGIGDIWVQIITISYVDCVAIGLDWAHENTVFLFADTNQHHQLKQK